MEFDPFSSDFFDDPYDTYRWLRDHAPVYHSERYGFWALSRHEDVVAAHRDWQTFSSSHGVTIDQLTDPRQSTVDSSIIFLDPPQHDRLRRLVSRVFTPKAMADLEPLVRTVVTRYLDRIGDGDRFDAVADLAAPFPVEVIATILGVPAPDRQQIRLWTDDMLRREADDPNPTREGMEAGIYFTAYLLDLVADKRAHPTDDMLSALIQADVPDDEGGTHRLTDAEIAGFGTLLAAAGSETVTKLIGSGVVLFARHPAEWRKVLDDVGAIGGAVEEILRYWAPSQYQGRFTRAAVTRHGVTIPAESPVLLLTGAANRDERAYTDPDDFRIDRPPQLSVGFGHGIHTCLGAALARLESTVAFEELRARWPRYEVDEAGLRRVQMANVAGYSNVPVLAA
jgi:cytochrome P450